MEPLKPAMRIAMLDVAKAHEGRLARILGFPHQFVAAEEVRQTVDAVIALRFGREQAARFATQLLHLPGAGADGIDTSALDPGCIVCNVFEHEIPVAEFVLTAILDHTIGYGRMHRAFDGARWSDTYAARRPHGEVCGKILGLVGYGHIGRAVAQRAKAFGMQVHAISHGGRAPGADWAGRPPELGRMLAVVDFLVIACPLSPQTRGLIGASELALMKPSAVVINIGRAQVIEEEPLFRALEAERLAGATLDVWYDYPLGSDTGVTPSRFPFDELPNVHCTAHSSAWSDGLFERRYRVIAENLGRLRQSLPLHNIIFPTP